MTASDHPSPFHDDQPTLGDELGHAPHVRRLGEMIVGCTPPFVLGIHGDWGTGKTSFLKKLHLFLAGKESPYAKADEIGTALWRQTYSGSGQGKVETIWFEAWRYQFDPNPVVALLNEIRAHFTWSRKLIGEAGKLTFAALMSIEELTKKIGIQPSKIVAGGEKREADILAQPLPSQLCRDLLQQAISTILKQGKKNRLVVFVDDLDRCRGEVAFGLLEALKIYLSLPNCVFVLGLDWRNVRRAVDAELRKAGMVRPDKDDPDRLPVEAEDYLNKLCQSIYNLPLLSDLRQYLGSLMTSPVFRVDPDDQQSGADEAWSRIIHGSRLLPQNPRKVKAFVNGLALYVTELRAVLGESRPGADVEPNHELALIVAYLKLLANDVFRVLESDRAFWHELVEFCRRGRSEHPALKIRRLPETVAEPGAAAADEPYRYFSAFRDPADETVFRAARLIREWEGGRPPTDDEFDMYVLLRNPRKE